MTPFQRLTYKALKRKYTRGTPERRAIMRTNARNLIATSLPTS